MVRYWNEKRWLKESGIWTMDWILNVMGPCFKTWRLKCKTDLELSTNITKCFTQRKPHAAQILYNWVHLLFKYWICLVFGSWQSVNQVVSIGLFWVFFMPFLYNGVYSNHLNTRLVRYSNGQKLSGCQMIRYSSGIWIADKKVWYSNGNHAT